MEQLGDVQSFGAVGQAVAAFGACTAIWTGTPMSDTSECTVPEPRVRIHIECFSQVSASQDIGDDNAFGTVRHTIPAFRAPILSQTQPVMPIQSLFDLTLFIRQRSDVVRHDEVFFELTRIFAPGGNRVDTRIGEKKTAIELHGCKRPRQFSHFRGRFIQLAALVRGGDDPPTCRPGFTGQGDPCRRLLP